MNLLLMKANFLSHNGWLLELYIWHHLQSYQDGYRFVTVHKSWQFYSDAAPLGDQAINITTQYLTQSYYPYNESTSPCHILIMPNT